MLGDRIRSRIFVPAKSNRRSASLVHDGKDYYKNYEESKSQLPDNLDNENALEDDSESEEEYEGIDGQKINPARMSIDSH